MTVPRITCIVLVDLSVVDEFGILDVRAGLRSCRTVPQGARARLHVGSARAVSGVYLHQLVEHLRPAATVEIEAHDGDFAIELYAMLQAAFTGEQRGDAFGVTSGGVLR